MSLPSRRPLAGLAALALLLTACGDDDPAGDTERPTIIATTSIWADLVADLACGGQARVGTLVPVGGDPHSFEPSLADRGDLERAALVVANGLGLEEGLDDTLDAVEDGGTPVIRVAELVDPLPYSGDHDAHDEDDDDEHDDDDEDDDEDHDEEHDDHDEEHDDATTRTTTTTTTRSWIPMCGSTPGGSSRCSKKWPTGSSPSGSTPSR